MNMLTRRFNFVIFLMILNIILQKYLNNFDFLNHKIFFVIIVTSVVYLWFAYYLTNYHKRFFQYYIIFWMVLVSFWFYWYDIQSKIFLSHNAIMLTILLAYIVSKLRNSKEVNLLKEQVNALSLQNRELLKAKLQFHQNIQHNHNVPFGALKTNFEIFSDLFFKKFLENFSNNTPHKDLASFEALKTSITAVQNNLEHVMSYIIHVNDVSRKCQKENICNIDYNSSINIIDVIQETLQPLTAKYKNKVLLKYNNNTYTIFKVYADKLYLMEAIFQLLKNQFKYVPSLKNDICIEIKQENLDILVMLYNGAHIPEKELENIFEPGTVAKANISIAGNRGYGITCARYIVEEHGGYVTAKNLNNKTYFYFALPMATSYSTSW